MLKIEKITNLDLVRIALASDGKMTSGMSELVDELKFAGLYQNANESDIERFEIELDRMEA